MRRLRRLASRLFGLVRGAERERELADELEGHLQMHVDDNLRSGMTPEEARRDALLQLGGVEATKEACRDGRTIPLVEHLLQDSRFALRQLARNPGFAFTAVLMLALGMGASVAIFGFVDAALVKPLPYPNPSRLVEVTESVALIPRANLSYLDYLDWKKMNKVFSSMEIHGGRGYMLATSTGTDLVAGARVSDGFFRTLGISPAVGRDFHAGEDLLAAPPTVILSHAAWQKRFGGRPDVVGQTATLTGVVHTIIGVLPADFHFAPRGRAEFWTTLHASGQCDLRRSCHNFKGIGRLRDGVSAEAALADTQLIARQLEAQYPDSNRGQGASVLPLSEAIIGEVRPTLLVLAAGAGLLLIIACTNVASLLLVRSESRKHEIAVRGALGASRARLVRQFFTEGLVLAAAGATLGLAFAEWAMQILTRLIPTDLMASMPYLTGLGLSLRLLALAGAIALVAALLFSLTPLLRLSGAQVRGDLLEGGRGSAGTLWRRLGAHLVVLELALAMVLLVGAGLLGKSFYRLLHVDLGFQPDHLATLEVAAPDHAYAGEQKAVRLGRDIVSRIASLPGVTSVAITSELPVSGNGNTDWIRFVGRPYQGEHNEVNQREVSAEYFTTLQATLLRGRYFTDAEDGSKPRVVIINRALARQYFPGADPLGQRIGDTALSPDSLKEIVGIVDDIQDGALDSEVWPAVYYPFNQSAGTHFALVVRTTQAPEAMLEPLGKAVRQIDPAIGTIGEATLKERIDTSPSAYLHRSAAGLVGAFAALALFLGVGGLYGVVAYSVSRRTREIGVRMALGAQPSAVHRLIVKEAGWLVLPGIALGTTGALAAATAMRKLLFSTPPWDAPTLAAVAATLAASALLASYIPARRAASVNSVEALRSE